MRWWRHGDLPLAVSLLLVVSTTLSIASLRWSALRPWAVCAWLGWAVALARVLLWISTWNSNVAGSAVVWSVTVAIELSLVLRPWFFDRRLRYTEGR